MSHPPSGADILFETEDVAVILVPGPNTRQVVVTFTTRLPSPQRHPVSGQEGFGRDYFTKAGISAFHVVPKWNHWWQSEHMDQTIETIRRHIPPGREVWTYGASMGGTGALMFARPLEATGVLALYPQASVDLTHASFDPRWIDDRQRIARHDDSWLDHPPTANTWLLSDPKFSLDQKHIDMIKQDYDGICLIPLDFSEHSCMRMLQECGMLSATIRSIFDGSFKPQTFRSAIRRARHRSPVALTGAANALARRGKQQLACRFSSAAVTLLTQTKQEGRSLDPATTVLAMHSHAINLVRARNRKGASNYLRHLRDAPLISVDPNLLAAIIIYWNTKHLGQAVAARQRAGLNCAPNLLAHISPLGWAHILLTGEYRWRRQTGASL